VRVSELLRGANLADREAELLLLHVLKRERSWLFAHSDAVLATDVIEQFNSLVARRGRGIPIAYLVGEREFWSLPLTVSPAVLIPRPDTELLVMWASAIARTEHWQSVLDLGTGSGAIALALASELPGCVVTAVDNSVAALGVAKNNGRRLKLAVEWIQSNWFSALERRQWPLIVSNPPYIRADDPHLTQGDLPSEPVGALVGGQDGLECIRAIVHGSLDHLVPNGCLLLEHGYDQADQVRQLMSEVGFSEVESRCDLAGHERVTGGRLR